MSHLDNPSAYSSSLFLPMQRRRLSRWLQRYASCWRLLCTKANSWKPLESILDIENYSMADVDPAPVRVRVKENVRSLGSVEQWKKRRCVYVEQDERTSWKWSQDDIWLDIHEYEEGNYREQNVPLEKRIQYRKLSLERDISLLAVRWFQRRRGTELKRQFYRHRHTIYARCLKNSSLEQWLDRLNIPASAFKRLSFEEQKDWFCAEVCRRLFTKRYLVALSCSQAHILARRLRLEVAKLGPINYLSADDKIHWIDKNNILEPLERLWSISNNNQRKERIAPDIIVLDDTLRHCAKTSVYSILDLAIRSLANYGLLCIHVDLPPLLEELQSLPFASELQLRMFLDDLIKCANVRKVYLEPVFSCVLQETRAHIWLRARKDLYGHVGWTRRSGLLYYCPHCYSYRIQPLEWSPAERQDIYGQSKWSTCCEYCGTSSGWLFGGSMYLDSLSHVRETSRILHELIVPVSRSYKTSATRMLFNAADMETLFSTMAAESRCSPLFLSIQKMNALFQSNLERDLVHIALKSRGYEAFPSHTSLDALKTNAPLDVVWDVWKSWKLYHSQPNSGKDLLFYKPLLYYDSKEWSPWLSSESKTNHTTTKEPMLAISKDARLFDRLHRPNLRITQTLGNNSTRSLPHP